MRNLETLSIINSQYMIEGRKYIFIIFFMFCALGFGQEDTKSAPVRIAVIGLTHTHVHWILGRPKNNDIEIVAIVEPNLELAKRYVEEHNLSTDLLYDSIDTMLEEVTPDAVTAFGNIFDHLKVVQIFAPLGIHVMVEKPLAISLDHAIAMKDLATKHSIHLLTNYETSWYASHHKARRMVEEGNIGELRKIVAHDGHKGPEEIGVNNEFLVWLKDPELNGGGAITDFGCYGANLITWIKHGEKPVSVTAITQTIKPDKYPNVDDEATIILEFPKMQGIIQASWNWPIARKDLEIYGSEGQIFCNNSSDITYQLNEETDEEALTLPDLIMPLNDPFATFAAVIKGDLILEPFDLSGLDNNMLVIEILEAAKKSAKTGTKVFLD